MSVIAQLLYDQLAIPGPSARAGRRRRWADRARRTYLRRIGDPVVRYRRWNLRLRLSHNLALYEALFPCYGTPVPRLAAALAAKYADLCCIDVGANVGDTAVQLHRAAAVPVLCIEGTDSFAALLEANVAALPGVRVVRAYVGETEGGVAASVDERGGSARLTPSAAAPPVPVRTLPALLHEQPAFRGAKLLKIDTDGFDLRVIRGALDWIGGARPVLFFEYDPSLPGNRGEDAAALFPLLAERGYRQALRYRNTGELDGASDLASPGIATDLQARIDRLGPDAYFDLCVCHDDDADVHGRLARGAPDGAGGV